MKKKKHSARAHFKSAHRPRKSTEFVLFDQSKIEARMKKPGTDELKKNDRINVAFCRRCKRYLAAAVSEIPMESKRLHASLVDHRKRSCHKR